MTPHRIPIADLDSSLPRLVGSASVVALIPVEAVPDWAPALAWDVARAAAKLGRRTLLVDCFVDAPCLHRVTGAPNEDGIVDAFEYGASLGRIAQPQPEQNLHFIPSGTFAADPAALMANRRWHRLSAGFRHEDALLLLFLPAAALPAIVAETDGIMALADEGCDFGRDAPATLADAASAGTPLVIVTAGAGSAALAGAAAGPPGEAPARPALRRSHVPFAELESLRGKPPKTRRAVVYAAVAVVAAVLGVTAWKPEWIVPPAVEEERPAAAARLEHAVEVLPFVIQVSSWDDAAGAFQAVDALEARGVRALVTPVRLPNRVSWRVHAGPYSSRSGADSVLLALQAGGLADRRGSVVLRDSLSFALGGGMSPVRARWVRDSLRALNVPTFLLGQRDGRLRLLAGAFDGVARSEYLDSLLSTLGRARRLGTRVGWIP